MKLTPFAKAFITIVILASSATPAITTRAATSSKWATGSDKGDGGERRQGRRRRRKDDFDALKNAPPIPTATPASPASTAANVGAGKLGRPLVVGINTWAGHAPGIVFNDGLDPTASSYYKTKYGLDVKFVLIEDPAAKLAAFRKGDVDIMWDTVDNWAREASILAEQNQQAKSIIMQDWSRGGDGIVSLAVDQRRSRS